MPTQNRRYGMVLLLLIRQGIILSLNHGYENFVMMQAALMMVTAATHVK
jgi:hypothetical protein